ncbi:MAG TPA: transposase, partial [Gemmataceae bacterium]
MERELWPLLYRLLRSVAKDFHQNNVTYQPWVLAAVLLWAALHDRPLAWACQLRHWSTTRLRPVQLPSPATLSRRLYKVGMGLFLRTLEQRLRDSGQPRLVAFLDGKPLVVSGVSKDPEAKRGRGAGGMAKGYKLHTVWSNRPMPEVWEVTPLNVHELVVAERLLGQLSAGGYVLADGNYDSSLLADRAYERGYQLVAPLPKNAGQGHRYQSRHRLRNRDLLAGEFGKGLYGQRGSIERSFGNATSFAAGLGPLPAWVRRLHRVRTWVWAKLLINGVRIVKKQGLTPQMQKVLAL